MTTCRLVLRFLTDLDAMKVSFGGYNTIQQQNFTC